jgi:hypothetical protein
VGRGAIIGWRDVLAPSLKSENGVVLWPFDGFLHDLLRPGRVVVVETYPAEYYGWFFRDHPLKGKGKVEARRQVGSTLLNGAESANVMLHPERRPAIEDGFANDDAFDAAVGLFGMLEVLLCRRTLYEPEEENLRSVEGWIFGQQAQSKSNVLS